MSPGDCGSLANKRSFIPISFGWAAGDVSLAAYIQASLARLEGRKTNVSSLGAVMAFLYSTYIVIYAIVSPLVGRYIDRVSRANAGNVQTAIRNLGGVQFTIIAALVIASTFIPKGSFAFNPDMIDDQSLDSEVDMDFGEEVSKDFKEMEKEISPATSESGKHSNAKVSRVETEFPQKDQF